MALNLNGRFHLLHKLPKNKAVSYFLWCRCKLQIFVSDFPDDLHLQKNLKLFPCSGSCCYMLIHCLSFVLNKLLKCAAASQLDLYSCVKPLISIGSSTQHMRARWRQICWECTLCYLKQLCASALKRRCYLSQFPGHHILTLPCSTLRLCS